MGSTQSPPCRYKSPTVTSMKVVYEKKESQTPYGPYLGNLAHTWLVSGYGPIPRSGHQCQFSPEQDKYALSHQFNSFEQATNYCKEQINTCGIIVELTLKGTLRILLDFYIMNNNEKLIQEADRDKSANYMKLDQQQRLYVIVLYKICNPLRMSNRFGKKR